jgi:hypothetical protein
MSRSSSTSAYPADVIVGPFPQDLLIDARPVFPPRKVVQDGRSARPNVDGELHDWI